MNINARTLKTLGFLLPLLRQFPEDTYVDINGDSIEFQATTQAHVRAIRSVFPGAVWKKEYVDVLKTWHYTTVVSGYSILIYACTEAPPTCHAVEEQYTEVERVPVAFKDRKVTKTRIRWECGNGA